jgi:hypothetical protein
MDYHSAMRSKTIDIYNMNESQKHFLSKRGQFKSQHNCNSTYLTFWKSKTTAMGIVCQGVDDMAKG